MITFQNSARVDYPQSHKDRRNLFTQNCFIARYRSDFSVFKLLWTTTYCAISFMSTDFSHSNVMCLYFLHMNYLCTIFKQSEWMKSFDKRVSFFFLHLQTNRVVSSMPTAGTMFFYSTSRNAVIAIERVRLNTQKKCPNLKSHNTLQHWSCLILTQTPYLQNHNYTIYNSVFA